MRMEGTSLEKVIDASESGWQRSVEFEVIMNIFLLKRLKYQMSFFWKNSEHHDTSLNSAHLQLGFDGEETQFQVHQGSFSVLHDTSFTGGDWKYGS